MNLAVWTGVIALFIVVLVLQLERLRQKTLSQLNQILYVDHDAALYLQLLNNRHLRILFTEPSLLHLRLHAYLLTDDEQNIQKAIAELDQEKLPRGEKIEYLAERLQYAVQSHQDEMALDSLRQLHQQLDSSTSEKNRQILEDAELIYRIYILKDESVLTILEKQLKSQNGLAKGITLYRTAKIHHFMHRDTEADNCLKEALPLTKGTAYEMLIRSCIQDSSQLN